MERRLSSLRVAHGKEASSLLPPRADKSIYFFICEKFTNFASLISRQKDLIIMTDYNEIVRGHFERLKPLFVNYLRKHFKISYDEIMDIYTNVWIDVRDNIRRGRTEEVRSWDSYILNLGWKQACNAATRRKPMDSIDDETFDHKAFEEQLQKEKEEEKNIYTDPELKAVLAAELNYIPDPCKQVLNMFYWQKYSMQKIADMMNYKSAASAKTTTQRCREKLKARVMNAVKRLGILD